MLRLGVLKRRAEDRPDLQQQIDQLVLLAEQTASELHDLAVGLRPSALDRYGLVSGLEQLIASFRQHNAVEVELAVAGFGEGRLDEAVGTTLYRVVQEGLTNVARHARATRVVISLCRDDHHVALVLEDNGCGFDVAEAQRSGRLGLLGMAERVEILGGTLKIESSPECGTTLQIQVPAQPV
jgi:signal transduction histidine kinase